MTGIHFRRRCYELDPSVNRPGKVDEAALMELRTRAASETSLRVNGLQQVAGSRDSFGSFDKEILEAATEIK